MTRGTTSPPTRFTARPTTARALWSSGAGSGEIRTVDLPVPGPDDVLVRALHSAVSRGTESLVWDGRAPEASWTTMRAPFQDGLFPGPVKYGYLSIGLVERGPAPLLSRTVFCLPTPTRRRTSCPPAP